MNTLTLNNIEMHYTDSALHTSEIFNCSYYVANNSPSWLIVAESIEDAREYMIDYLDCVEDPDDAENDDERELLESYFSIEEKCEFVEFVEEFGSVDETDLKLANYMIDHGGDDLYPNDYLDLISDLEGVGDYDTIDHHALSREFLIIDEDEIDRHFHARIEELVKDCYLNGRELPSFIEIDWEKTAENCKIDGYGNEFSSYDGSEDLIDGWYVFCTN